MNSMDEIITIHGGYALIAFILFFIILFAEADSDIVCQPGVRWMDINDVLKEKGMGLNGRCGNDTDVYEILGIPLFFPVNFSTSIQWASGSQ